MPRRYPTAIERFWKFVSPEPFSGCWLWTGCILSPSKGGENGYGRFGIGKAISTYAHRWAYENFRGPIPAGLDLDHLCRVRSCVNPDHLEPVTRSENVLRGKISAERNQTHCKHGHEFDAANTYAQKTGLRRCRRCAADREKIRRHMLKSARLPHLKSLWTA